MRIVTLFIILIIWLLLGGPVLAQDPTVYTQTLTSGNVLAVQYTITFGEILVIGSLLLVVAVLALNLLVKVVYR